MLGTKPTLFLLGLARFPAARTKQGTATPGSAGPAGRAPVHAAFWGTWPALAEKKWCKIQGSWSDRSTNICYGVPAEGAWSGLCFTPALRIACCFTTPLLQVSILHPGIALRGADLQIERIELEILRFTYFSQATPHYLLSYVLPELFVAVLVKISNTQEHNGDKWQREERTNWSTSSLFGLASNWLLPQSVQAKTVMDFFFLPPVH